MQQDTLEDAGRGGIALGAGLPCKLRRASQVLPDVGLCAQCVRTKRALMSAPRTAVYIVWACSVQRIGHAGHSRTQGVPFC